MTVDGQDLGYRFQVNISVPVPPQYRTIFTEATRGLSPQAQAAITIDEARWG